MNMEDKVMFRHSVSLHLRGIRELHKVSAGFFPILTLYCVFNAVIPYVTVFFSAQILKELATGRQAEVLWKWVIISVLGIGAAAIGKAFLYRRYQTLLSDLYGRKEILFIRKMFSLDFSELDKQETHDLRSQIQQDENWGSWGLMKLDEIYMSFVTGVIGLICGISLTVSLFTSPVPEGSGWLTVLNHPGFALVFAGLIAAGSILAGKLTAVSMKGWGQCAEDATFGNRLFSHFGFICMDTARSVDIRMSDQHALAASYFRLNNAFGADSALGKIFRGRIGIVSSLGACVIPLVTGLIYLFTCLKARGGAFDVGSITQYVGAATAMTNNIHALTELTGLLKTNAPYLENTFAFLDIRSAMYQGSLTTEKRADRNYNVEFRDVSFRYPGSDRWALRHFSMKLQVGKRLAIVGENGSGKTTFIKLLCRLYDPQEGQILLNGIDIRKYNYRDYMDIFSVVFQDFQLVSQPLGNNVAGSMNYDRERAQKALADAGFGDRLSAMEKGLNTMLYKNLDEDGVEISGGEAQKIALARALYKDAPFIILDEPTAALDPIAEAEIYAKFNDIAGDKTAVYISHRLSSCKFCDEIAVFHEGQIIQQGTHEELVAIEGGKYHELWTAQAQYYAGHFRIQ
ncbi:MAG: ABC transporter ATP-binding protein [Lachnospiraceae bacterium]|nr:ABC transporter ATP-binding protein [Lachnospiraceae bacterium]